jgi:LuxR family maltose regulon positive regulatory protein
MAVLACFRGQISGAETLGRRAVDLADRLGIPEPDRPPAAPSALAWVGALREDLRTASEQIEVVQRSEPMCDDPVADTLLTMAKARVQAVRGNVAGALEDVGEVTTDTEGHAPWLVDRLRIETGHLRVANGEPELALLELEGVRTTGSEAEIALVTSQAALARGGDAAETLAPALHQDAPLTTQVEAWLVEAARQIRGGSKAVARDAVDRALRLAMNERLRMPFGQAPADVRRLLKSDPRLQAANPWLAGDDHRVPARQVGRRLSPGERSDPQATTPLVQELTARELEVLGHLAEFLTTEEIASTMFLSVNTVRTHVRSILRKLGAPRRNAAVRRARDLGVLPVQGLPPIPEG